jgi:hypothetical protein
LMKCLSLMGSVHSDDDEDDEEPLRQETGFGNVIVVDNLPVVPGEKFDKLNNVVTKIFSQIGEIREGASHHCTFAVLTCNVYPRALSTG